jgi:signal transduction histidine kinase
MIVPPASEPGAMVRDIPLRALLSAGIIFCGLIPLVIVALVSFSSSRVELKAQAFRQLESIRDIKIDLLQKYYFERRADVRVFAENPFVLQTFKALTGGKRAGPLAGSTAAAVRAGDFSFFGSLLREYRYREFYILEAEQGKVIFSLRDDTGGEGDGTADDSPGLKEVWLSAREGASAISDLRPSEKTVADRGQFLAGAIREEGKIVGVVAVRISEKAVDSIMDMRPGMGLTGSTYLLGTDGIVRSPASASPSKVVPSGPGRFAGSGSSGFLLGTGISEERALIAYRSAEIPGLDWSLVAEVGESEIDQQIARALNRKITVLIGISLILLMALSFLISNVVSRNVFRVIGELRRLIGEVLSGRSKSRGDADAVAVDFRPVVVEVNALIEALEQQIGESRRLEDHLRDAQRLESIGILAAGIAHDFNNLLGHMSALAFIVESEIQSADLDLARIEELKIAIRRGAELVRQILTFSRPGRGEKKDCDLTALTVESLRLVRAALPADIRLVFEGDEVVRHFRADPSQWHQIVLNLCLNAIQAMAQTGGILTVSLTDVDVPNGEKEPLGAGRYLRLSVSDEGPGIPGEIRARIFEPFFTTKNPDLNSGLGLSVTAGIVMGYGGMIQVEDREGRGSRFDVFLPLNGALK